MSNEQDTNASVPQLPHHAEKLLDLIVVEGRGRLIENQNLAVHIDRSRDGDHLLHSDRIIF